ncbi:hypothetical protein XpopCFBP1817_07870 [Xanthomonas populi]|uniref:Uncharacterized protein n=1 Tax=Xanthomonas populi TaxID=53414 RepID=A0A2S7ERP5_9XANT|nr:hypothetical protein XpopCFBP1817_07870 [Xanthomonas populi]
MHTDHLDWSLPAHRRGTLRGMDAWTYLRRVPRWWAGKDPAARSQIRRFKTQDINATGRDSHRALLRFYWLITDQQQRNPLLPPYRASWRSRKKAG